MLTIAKLKAKLSSLTNHVMYDVTRSRQIATISNLSDPDKAERHRNHADRKMSLIMNAALPNDIDQYALINLNMPSSEYKLADIYLGYVSVLMFGSSIVETESMESQLCKDQPDNVQMLIREVLKTNDCQEGSLIPTLIRLASIDYMNYAKTLEQS